jgi:hypothetical protein
MVVALTKRVYRTILEALEGEALGWKVIETCHELSGGGKRYRPKSCWIVYREAGPMLLVWRAASK